MGLRQRKGIVQHISLAPCVFGAEQPPSLYVDALWHHPASVRIDGMPCNTLSISSKSYKSSVFAK